MVLVQRGRQDAFEALFARHRDPLWGFLVRKTGDRDGAADVYQEAFLRVWKSAHTYREGQSFKPWLYRIALNTARDRWRRTQREPDTVALDPELRGRRRDPMSGRDLERAIAALPDTLREAFLLGAVQGMDHNEVAAALDITPSNARARISRARSRLRAALAESGEEA